MLEPYAGKLARTVLRGGGDGNAAPLPDRQEVDMASPFAGGLRRIVVAVLVCGFTGADEPKKREPVKVDLMRLEGVWVIDSAFVGGREIERHKGKKVEFKGTTLRFLDLGGKEESGEVKVDPTKRVKELDYTPDPVKYPSARSGPGIYRLDGDTLEICIGDKKRPAEINRGDLLYVLNRQKK
jgi:uncharacterized protein (TIGR03067 family)